MNGIYRRIRQAGTRTLHTVTEVRAPGGRARAMVAAIAAIVLAVGLLEFILDVPYGFGGSLRCRRSSPGDRSPSWVTTGTT